jgi:hypothetical protein
MPDRSRTKEDITAEVRSVDRPIDVVIGPQGDVSVGLSLRFSSGFYNDANDLLDQVASALDCSLILGIFDSAVAAAEYEARERRFSKSRAFDH